MPPLCTAGYGLATGSFKFFFGAFYLYIINSVFIGVTTFAFVKYFKFKKKIYIDRKNEKKIHSYIIGFSILIIIPSLFMAYDVISESTFKKNARHYVVENFTFEKSRVISSNFIRSAGHRAIEVTIVGEPLSEDMISHLKLILPRFELQGAELKIIQSGPGDRTYRDGSLVDNSVSEQSVINKDKRILYLENELSLARSKDRLLQAAVKEVNILFPAVESISFGDLLVQDVQTLKSEKEVGVLVKWKRFAMLEDKKRLELYLKSRLEIENLEVIEVR